MESQSAATGPFITHQAPPGLSAVSLPTVKYKRLRGRIDAPGGDGGLAILAGFQNPSTIAVGPDDTIYVTEFGSNRIRSFRPGSTIDTLAGTGVAATNGDGDLARRAAVHGTAQGSLSAGR